MQKELNDAVRDKIIENYSVFENICIVQFTHKSEMYTLKIITNKDKFPNAYWIGPAPNHELYKDDSNGEEENPRKRTHLANTRFGIYTLWYTPEKTLIDIVKRIIESLN